MTEREFDETTLWTPANIVTLVRILLVPVFVVAIISPWPTYIPDWHNAELCKPWVAALIFAILSCTDALEGRGNELRKVHSSLGRQDLGGGGVIGAYRTSGSSFMGCVAHNRS